MHGKDTNEDTQTFEVVITRIIDAPVEEVWKAWSEPAYVIRWWGPTGFTSPRAEMDFRVGGASLVSMRAPAEYGGQDMYNTWTYTRIDPHERIEFVSNFADKEGRHLDGGAMDMPPGVPHDVPHKIVFSAAGEGRTELTVTEHVVWPHKYALRCVRTWVKAAWRASGPGRAPDRRSGLSTSEWSDTAFS